jgi:hypothetical protein
MSDCSANVQCGGPWTPEAQKASDTSLQTQAKAVTDALNALPYYQNIASLGITSGAANVTNSKAAIDAALANMNRELCVRKQCAADIVSHNQSVNATNVASLGETISELKPIVEQQEVIYKLRQEQANALANKYASSAYSSWWPLWFPIGDAKPLGDVTRTALYFFTAASLVVLATSSRSSPSSEGTNQLGGSRTSRKIRK